ncbi:MAG: hypothetical protein ACM3X4_01280 [Ignavibacteriales bacterium]
MSKPDFENELKRLIDDARDVMKSFAENKPVMRIEYQKWYTRALGAVRSLMPDRLAEFQQLYRDERRKEIAPQTYGIRDYLEGYVFTLVDIQGQEPSLAYSKLQQQFCILLSATTRLNDILANVKGTLQADLFDNEVDAAKDLLRNGHLRAAGTVAGVVLEQHLKTIAHMHTVKTRGKNPSISDYNDALKNAEVYDVSQWRLIQRLADLRNLCCHARDREPTKDEVEELVRQVDKVIKTVS